MTSTLRFESFNNINLRERTSLSADVAAAVQTLNVDSSDGYAPGDIIYIGVLAREGCEKASVESVPSKTTIDLVAPLGRAHDRFEPVTSVIGDRINIRRALNVNDRPPDIDQFAVYANRSIDEDQTHTYYTDSTGSADYWYLPSYWDQATSAETALSLDNAIRGDDYGRYATLEDIRGEAGFSNAQNLKDYDIDIQRRSAEAEINLAFSVHYTVPFKPVPEFIRMLTIKLAAAMLLVAAYGDVAPWSTRLKDARAAVVAAADGSAIITDDDGDPLTSANGVDFDFGDEPNMFSIGQVF